MNIDNKIYIYPTDTVWGIGADIYCESAQVKIAQIKGTATDKPLSILFENMEMLEKYIQFPFKKEVCWKTFFNLEVTLLIPKIFFNKLPQWIVHDSNYVGVRVLPLDIFKKIDTPITSTSLNIKGEASITTLTEAEAFRQQYCQDAEFVSSKVGLSGYDSTIILMEENDCKIIRKGFRFDEISKILGL